MIGGLDKLFNPAAVAIIGATDRAGSLGFEATSNALKSTGISRVHLVNPKRERLFDHPCHASISAIAGSVDVAYILLPAEKCIEAVAECGRAGIHFAIVAASGFGDGGRGVDQGERLRAAAAEAGVRLVGPNTNGLWNGVNDTHIGFNVSQGFRLAAGRLGVISQSGAMLGSTVARLHEQGIGLGYAVATGNELDLQIHDYLEFMLSADEIDVVALAVDAITDPLAFVRAVLRGSGERRKPILLLQMGTSNAGAAATELHASRLADSVEAASFLMGQLGIAVTTNFDAYLAALAILGSRRQLPEGGEVLGLSSSGAGAAILADIGENVGLHFPGLSPEASAGLSATMRLTVPHNPLDLTGESRDPQWVDRVYSDFSGSSPTAALAFLATLLFEEPFDPRAELYARLAETQPGRLCLACMPAALSAKYSERLKQAGVIGFSSVTDMFSGLDLAIAAQAYAGTINREWLSRWLENCERRATSPSLRTMVHHEVERAMAGYSIRFPASAVVGNDADALARAGESIGFPVALKLLSEERLHKASSNALAINLQTRNQLLDARRAMRPAPADLFLVQRMVPPGLDLFVGFYLDPQYGGVLLLGAGGGDVEHMLDIRTVLLPTASEEIRRQINELRIAPVILSRDLAGYIWDVDNLVKTINSFVEFVLADRDEAVVSAEINPLRLFGRGLGTLALDARTVLGRAVGQTLTT